MKKRTIIDGGGIPRKMELEYEENGTEIYVEPRTGVVGLFLEYDSNDDSCEWCESWEIMLENFPQLMDS